MTEEFNFVIARFWEGTNQLCVYTIHNREVQYGDMDYAEALCNYVNRKKDNSEYKIYRFGRDI